MNPHGPTWRDNDHVEKKPTGDGMRRYSKKKRLRIEPLKIETYDKRRDTPAQWPAVQSNIVLEEQRTNNPKIAGLTITH